MQELKQGHPSVIAQLAQSLTTHRRRGPKYSIAKRLCLFGEGSERWQLARTTPMHFTIYALHVLQRMRLWEPLTWNLRKSTRVARVGLNTSLYAQFNCNEGKYGPWLLKWRGGDATCAPQAAAFLPRRNLSETVFSQMLVGERISWIYTWGNRNSTNSSNN